MALWKYPTRCNASPSLVLCESRISRYCEDKGWQRTHDQHRTDYKLKWCEIKSRANYYHFREGAATLRRITVTIPLITFWNKQQMTLFLFPHRRRMGLEMYQMRS